MICTSTLNEGKVQLCTSTEKKSRTVYTLSNPENDRDVTDRVQEYTLQDASFMRQSRCSFLNV